MEAKEEVRAKLNIEDVIAEYVQLKRAGRNWKGLSPFSSEKTPSFIVSPDKQIWHDFSTNKGGDVFSFVMEVEGLDFRQTLEMLARKAGVDLSLYDTGSDRGLAKKKTRLYAALDLAAKFYQHSLVANPKVLEYVFKKRGFSKQVVQQFQIGYAPNADDALVKALVKRGFTRHELQDSGMLVQRRGRDTDMFRTRMMVPLHDSQGRVVGFTARLLEDIPDAPKYINTPQTLLYDKGRQVYGFHLAKEAIRKRNFAVVVEGNLDVVSSHQAGVANVVATAGTAMTLDHLKQLARLTNDIRLAFDSDAAGLAATERAIPIAQTAGVRLSIITLPGAAKDPDELIQQDPKLWQEATEESTYVVDWVIEQYANRCDLTSAEGKRTFTTKALEVIRTLQDPVEQEHYLQVLAERAGASLEAIKAKLNKTDEKPPARRLKPMKAEKAGPDDFAYQDSFLALNWAYNDLRDSLLNMTPQELEGEHRQKVLAYLLERGAKPSPAEVPRSLQSVEVYVKILLLKAETRYGQWNSTDRYIEASTLARKIRNEKPKKQREDLRTAIREAQVNGNDSLARELLQHYQQLIKEQKNRA